MDLNRNFVINLIYLIIKCAKALRLEMIVCLITDLVCFTLWMLSSLFIIHQLAKDNRWSIFFAVPEISLFHQIKEYND